MLIIKNQCDMENVKLQSNIDPSIIAYIEEYFKNFAKEVGVETERGISIEKYGIIVILEKGDRDINTGLPSLPSMFRAVPEDVRLIEIDSGGNGTKLVYQSLILCNNEFGIDVFGMKDEVSDEIADLMDQNLNP